jgi:hypothetical protein
LRLPQLLASFYVEGPEKTVGCAGDEYQTAGGRDRATKTDRSRWNLLGVRSAKILQRT